MRARPAELFPSPRDGLFDQLAMVVHAIQAGLHGIQQELRQRGVVTVLGKARHQCALLAHPLLTLCDVPDRLGKVVMLRCHRSHVFARAAAGLGPDSSFLRNSTSGNVELCGGAGERRAAVNESRQDYAASSGILSVARSPLPSNSNFTFPPRALLTSRPGW